MATFALDAWKDQTPEQLKESCRRLNRECGRLTLLLAAAVENVPGLYDGIPEPARSEIKRRLAHLEYDSDSEQKELDEKETPT